MSELARGATLQRLSGEKGRGDAWAWGHASSSCTRLPPSSLSSASYPAPTPRPHLGANFLHRAGGELKADRPDNGRKRGDTRNGPGVMRGGERGGHRETREWEREQAVAAPRGSRGPRAPSSALFKPTRVNTDALPGQRSCWTQPSAPLQPVTAKPLLSRNSRAAPGSGGEDGLEEHARQ